MCLLLLFGLFLPLTRVSFKMKESSVEANFMMTTLAAALVAGLSAYCATGLSIKKKNSKEYSESVLMEQLSEIKSRLNELEFARKRRRRTSKCSRSSLSFRTDEREFTLDLISCLLIEN